MEEVVETLKEGEQVYRWEELSEQQVRIVVAIHAHGFASQGLPMPKSKLGTLARLFELGRPKIVFGPGHKYCRIHQDSVDVMKVITREYL